MRWDELFADLSGQGAADDAAVLANEVADRSRWEAGRAEVVDRARSWGPGRIVTVGLPAAETLRGPLLAVGQDWMVVGDGPLDRLVPAAAVRWLQPEGPVPDQDRTVLVPAASGAVMHRLRLAHAVRLLVRDRAYVRIRLVEGEAVSGTLDRAGRDHADLAQHPCDLPRRASAVRSSWLLPYSAIGSIRGGQVWSAP